MEEEKEYNIQNDWKFVSVVHFGKLTLTKPIH